MVEHSLLHRDSKDFPSQLLELTPWPNELYCHGPWSEAGKSVAIVGARAATRQGMQRAFDLAKDLANSNVRVISGGALGIDAAAHKGALAGSGYTAAVMACGLDGYYPKRHASLFAKILETKGALLSPFAPGYPPLPANFVRRNSIIAILADIVVVVEASTRSGSLHTARFASRYGRQLVCFEGSAGCASLAARGVEYVSGAEDVLTLLAGGEITEKQPVIEISDTARVVLVHMSKESSLDTAQLARHSKLSIRQVHRLANELSLLALVITLPGQRYIRSPLGQAFLDRE